MKSQQNGTADCDDHEATVENSERAYGRTHPNTLNIRLTQAEAAGPAGNPGKAAELADRLTEDWVQTLGDAHLATLQARFAHAAWTAEAGNKATAQRLLETLYEPTPRDCSTTNTGSQLRFAPASSRYKPQAPTP
jgi:hypothetical protein